MRRFATALFGALAVASAAFGADESQIIYPAGKGAANAAAAGGSGLGSLSLILGALLAAVGAWFIWRGRQHTTLSRDGRLLEINETRSLGNRQYLVVASYEDKKFLLGVCPGRIDLLAPLHDQPEKFRS